MLTSGGSTTRVRASVKTKNEMTTKNNPLTNPDNTSNLSYLENKETNH